jgi:hypothetical protein
MTCRLWSVASFYALVELLSGDSEKVQKIRELEKQQMWLSILR